MFDVHIDYSFYEKNLWDNLNLFKLVCMNISLYFLELWMDCFCKHIEMCFENLWQVMIKNSVLYLVFSKDNHIVASP